MIERRKGSKNLTTRRAEFPFGVAKHFAIGLLELSILLLGARQQPSVHSILRDFSIGQGPKPFNV